MEPSGAPAFRPPPLPPTYRPAQPASAACWTLLVVRAKRSTIQPQLAQDFPLVAPLSLRLNSETLSDALKTTPTPPLCPFSQELVGLKNRVGLQVCGFRARKPGSALGKNVYMTVRRSLQPQSALEPSVVALTQVTSVRWESPVLSSPQKASCHASRHWFPGTSAMVGGP